MASLKQAALKHGWRSGLEDKVALSLGERGIEFDYERFKVRYLVPQRASTYTPDFVLQNGIVVETKGRWVTEDRRKIKLVLAQHPDLDLRIVFSNPNARISKQSQTTYAMICDSLKVPWAAKDIPNAWVEEPYCEKRWSAIRRAELHGKP